MKATWRNNAEVKVCLGNVSEIADNYTKLKLTYKLKEL